MELDELDLLASNALEGFIVRKDLVRRFSRIFPLPTYVVEFMLGKYCASTDNDEIQEGLQIVERQLYQRSVRTGEEELVKSNAREHGTVRIIDKISAHLDVRNDEYEAEIPSLKLTDVAIEDSFVLQYQRMLTGGFYADIVLRYDAQAAKEKKGRPFSIESIKEIQLSQSEVLAKLMVARKAFTTPQWKRFLLRSIGIEPATLDERQINALLLRMIPFVERNYNLVELGPRGTGKSHLFQQISPYAHLVSGGKATVAKMFVNLSTGHKGLVAQYDVVCFDEVSGVSFDQKDGVNIMKGYMESGEFSRGRDSIRADGSIVMVGNFDVDVEHQQRISHLFGPLPPEMRNDTAFMDRIHCFLPGWDVPKVNQGLLTNHFGMVSDFLSECWRQLRNQSRLNHLQNRVFFGGALSGRDTNAVNKTINGLLKLLSPDPATPISDEDLEWAVRIALESRRRVKEQQKRIGPTEFRSTHFSYTMGLDGAEHFVATPELHSESTITGDPLEPGHIWTINIGSDDEALGLYRIEVTDAPGSGFNILNKPIPPKFKESVEVASSVLAAKSKEFVGQLDPRQHEFAVQLRSFDTVRSGHTVSLAVLLSMATSLLKKPTRGGLVVVGALTLGGALESIYNSVRIVELAVEKGATTVLLPVACRRQLNDLADDIACRVNIEYYQDGKNALFKAMEG